MYFKFNFIVMSYLKKQYNKCEGKVRSCHSHFNYKNYIYVQKYQLIFKIETVDS